MKQWVEMADVKQDVKPDLEKAKLKVE